MAILLVVLVSAMSSLYSLGNAVRVPLPPVPYTCDVDPCTPAANISLNENVTYTCHIFGATPPINCSWYSTDLNGTTYVFQTSNVAVVDVGKVYKSNYVFVPPSLPEYDGLGVFMIKCECKDARNRITWDFVVCFVNY